MKFVTEDEFLLIIIPIIDIVIIVLPLMGPETDPRVSGPPAIYFQEVIKSITFNPLCYPNRLLIRTEVAEPDVF